MDSFPGDMAAARTCSSKRMYHPLSRTRYSTPPGPPMDMVYWVTVRTYENIPQLFSALGGHTNGAIAAVGTAALAAKIIPGSFWGMNKRGDCQFSGGSANAGFTYTGCGVDIDVFGNGPGKSCGAGLPSAYLCAPSGIILSSTCANNNLAGCGNTSPGGQPALIMQVTKALFGAVPGSTSRQQIRRTV